MLTLFEKHVKYGGLYVRTKYVQAKTGGDLLG